MLKSFLSFLQIVIPIFLIVLVVAQNKAAGLGEMFGGGGTFQATRRGADKVLHTATIVCAVLFLTVTMLSTYFA